jgi:[acyl-carrier-protein] S-malonyltransferase
VGIDGGSVLTMDVVLLFPGQGSQAPGMGKDLAEAFASSADVFREADDALGVSLSRLCFAGSPDELMLTHNAQPALLAHGAAIWAALKPRLAGSVRAAAGHSLGEFTAYQVAGALNLGDALRLVRRRGELMYESGRERPGAMAAILGSLTTPIEIVCEQATREAGLVVPANYNGPGQVVISGECSGVDRAMALAKDAGAKRSIRLSVSGAFHSPLMEPARAGLADALDRTPLGRPAFPVYSNVTAEPVDDATVATQLLLEQLVSPVQWTAEVTALAARFPDALYLEMGPGSVLTGLAKKIAPSIRTAPCGTAAQIAQVSELFLA